ncbi:MAG TPA: YbhB/YbcL family Raf kinase inhibitor-like protein [Ilumatobacteraceae bacterium]|nr:YbhB/YbcL family Raf kinase inhibitor-like protein [Ilumatobacteraceae bacterium]
MLRRPSTLLVALAASAVITLVACDTDDGRSMRPPTSEQRANMPTTTTTSPTAASTPAELGAGVPDLGAAGSSTTLPGALATVVPAPVIATFSMALPWANGGAIDARFTCDGADLSPLLTWTAPPAGTVELALLVTDDDAGGYVHWAVAGIPPAAGEKGEGATITGAVEGVNDAGTTGWSGPCPPAGGPHTYRFQLFALDQQAELPDGFTGDDLDAIAAPASIAVAELTGTYQRAG